MKMKAVLRLAMLLPFAASAQEYPEKPVQIVLPLQVGSASDIAVRVFAERLGEGLKQPFVVENVTGAAGLIGAERLAKSRPDGYTLAALNSSILTILPNIQRERVKFNPFEDFVPIHGIANIPTLLGVNEALPVRNVRELIEHAKAKPGELNYATGGPGSPQHLAGEMFMAMSGTRMTQVPYKGATAAAAGRATTIPRGSRSSRRKGTPAPVLSRLRTEAAKVLPGLKERLEKSGLELWAVPASDLPNVIKEDHARWQRVVREANIRAE